MEAFITLILVIKMPVFLRRLSTITSPSTQQTDYKQEKKK
jgi:hypothetical protein